MNDQDERVRLDPLDPGTGDPGFWIRFHSGVMERASGELARRRHETELGVAEVVFAWRRALVPLALMAAALSGILLVDAARDSGAAAPPMALEEALTLGLPGDPVPALTNGAVDLDEVAFLTMAGRR